MVAPHSCTPSLGDPRQPVPELEFWITTAWTVPGCSMRSGRMALLWSREVPAHEVVPPEPQAMASMAGSLFLSHRSRRCKMLRARQRVGAHALPP
jgi:hypothetical protein